jgi:sigma-B regulation protein RsbU (phosphoserine phosphatase)
LDIARQVQAGLFPQRRPPVATLDYFGTCRTAREVGGDYFDFLEIGPAHLGLAVGDISGKGVSAALLMSNLQAMFRSRAAAEGLQVGRLVADVNRLLADSTDPSKFATLFYAVFDTRSRRLVYVNAGHNPPFLLRESASQLRRLQPTGMALGFTASACYEVAEELLVPGDVLVVFTDGVTEALDEDGNEYGEDRLVSALMEQRRLEAQPLCEHILADVARHVGTARQHDDITLVVARVR